MKSFAVFVLALTCTPALLAQHQNFAVNSDSSEVKITLNTTHEVVNGTFHVQSGSIDFDQTASRISGMITSSVIFTVRSSDFVARTASSMRRPFGFQALSRCE